MVTEVVITPISYAARGFRWAVSQEGEEQKPNLVSDVGNLVDMAS